MKKRRIPRTLSMYSCTVYHGSSTVLAENECVLTERYSGVCSEPMGPIHIHAFLNAARYAKLEVGDFVEVTAHHRKKPSKQKIVRCLVLAINEDPKRNQLVTWKRGEAGMAYLLQQTGMKDYPLSDEDFDQGLKKSSRE